jgi:predicted house-cleaning noncanonical NTP pyrophosphatase (MazG superfamily)
MKQEKKHKIYRKLVRDNIPDMIVANEQTPEFYFFPSEDFENELIVKMGEEMGEYLQDKKPEELADILEVLIELAKIRNIPFSEIEALRQKKLAERGGFSKRIFLVKVEENAKK